MLGLLIAACALLGLVIGSFLNVVIYRVPRHESIVTPRSRCPSCDALIRGVDNIPVLSWLLLRGRCRNCHQSISSQYIVVELICGALFAGLAVRFGYRIELVPYLVLFAGLLALSCIDLQFLTLPKVVVYPVFLVTGVLFVGISAHEGDWSPLIIGAICAGAWYALFLLINLASPRLLGFGDVRLSLVLGLGLGWLGWRYAVLGFFVSNLVGAIVGVLLIVTKRASRDQPIPYGVFLSIGLIFSVFAGPEIISSLLTLH